MFRSVAAITALSILPSLASGQEIAAGQQGTHTVVKGNTLWHLAEHYLGNPFLWPLIYEANTDRIEDPHWIYPGQVFIIPGLEGARGAIPAGEGAAGQIPIQDVTVVSQGGQPGAGFRPTVPPAAPCPAPDNRTVFYSGESGDRGCTLPVPAPGDRTTFYLDPETSVISGNPSEREDVLYAVPRSTVYGFPWLEDWGASIEDVGMVARFAAVDMEATPRERARFLEYLQIELNEGVELRVGDLLQTYQLGRSHEELGQVVEPTGILAVTAVEESGVLALVSVEFDRVRLGQRLRMAPAYDFMPGIVAEDVESDLTATLLGFAEDRVVQGIGAVGFLDVGEAEGIRAGDEFSAYVNKGDGWSGEEAARLQVVVVSGSVSSARIVTVTDPVLRVGSELRLVKKMR